MLEAIHEVREGQRVACRCPRTGTQLQGTYRTEEHARQGEARALPQRADDLRVYLHLYCPTCADLHPAARVLAEARIEDLS